MDWGPVGIILLRAVREFSIQQTEVNPSANEKAASWFLRSP